MRSIRSSLVLFVCAALLVALLPAPVARVQAIDDSTVSNITITQLDCNGWYVDGFITWDKDNTGRSRERYYVRVYDGDNTLISEHTNTRPVGESRKLIYPGSVPPPHTYELATPDYNPLTIKLYSPGDNGTVAEEFTLGTGSCSDLPTYSPAPTLQANDDNYSTPYGTTLNEPAPGVLGNDVFPRPESTMPVTWVAQKQSDPSNGTVTLNADGSFTYVPNAGFSGQDSFTYKFVGALEEIAIPTSNTATVTITVGAQPFTPTAVDDNYTTPFGTTLNEPAPGVLGNDQLTPLEVGVSLVAQKQSDPSNGTVTLNGDGSFSYVPDAGFSGQDSFTYALVYPEGSDEARAIPTATVTITVQPENTPDPTPDPTQEPTPEPTQEPTPEPTPVPGCNAFIQIPETAVGGMLVSPAVLQYAPGMDTNPALELGAGKTLLVLMRDATGEYYQVLWQCQKLWLPVGAVGPNPEYPWNGAPLP